MVIYIADILIYPFSLAQQQRHIKLVLEKLREHHLYLKLEKCEFHNTNVQFLGYIINQQGVQMDQKKVEAIQNWRLPSRLCQLLQKIHH